MRQSSPLLGPWSYPQHPVCAGCGQPLLGRGPSRRSLCASFPACLAPYPGGSCGASTRFFPQDIGLPLVRTGSALHYVPYSDFSTARFSRLQSLLDVQAHRCARHPDRSSRYGTPYGSCDFSIRASRGLLPPHAPDMLAVRIGQWTAEDFHLIRCAALSAAPRTLPVSGGPQALSHAPL
jgi:hypothetical protein